MISDKVNDDIQEKANLLLQQIYERQNTPSVKRKNLELELVRLIQSYMSNGLDIESILIDVTNDGINASVYLNETTNTQAKAVTTKEP
ncbi:hypothetical protein KWE42_17170 [Acinetobacter pittii]|uniref:Uncharacterized protein n=1 Tax=Acinetobacter pittii TaxID=48296 RepID=A0AAE9S9W1_ACIPI|nr:hypothetical protein [Acinetobacter pittii]AZP30411.1 hypothetical protein DLK06_15745 [Acinetobacter pittii]USU93792.1 hypothetical protein MWH18_15785 [Acinetobacter pittii]